MMSLTYLQKKELNEAREERNRLRRLQYDLSNYALAKKMGIPEIQIKRYFEKRDEVPVTLSLARAMDIANLIRIRRCPMAVIKTGDEFDVVDAASLTENPPGYIGTYNHNVNAQTIFGDCNN
jgi:hypothetical protein